MIGRRFERLVVVSLHEERNGRKRYMCKCDCGGEKVVEGSNLYGGQVRSCGCLQSANRIKHGKNGSPTYKIWGSMIQRCHNIRAKFYEEYGGRGIHVCDRWRDFTNFLADMGECPRGLTIERVNNNGHYEPGNCVWAPRKDQARNRRANNLLTYNGRTQCLTDWAAEIGMSAPALRSRLKRMSLDEALTTPRDDRQVRNVRHG